MRLADRQPERFRGTQGLRMKIGTPRELEAGEARVAMTPESIAALKKLGYECLIEAGAGAGAGFTDDA